MEIFIWVSLFVNIKKLINITTLLHYFITLLNRNNIIALLRLLQSDAREFIYLPFDINILINITALLTFLHFETREVSRRLELKSKQK